MFSFSMLLKKILNLLFLFGSIFQKNQKILNTELEILIEKNCIKFGTLFGVFVWK